MSIWGSSFLKPLRDYIEHTSRHRKGRWGIWSILYQVLSLMVEVSSGVTPWHFQPDLYTSLAHSPGQGVTRGRETWEAVIVHGNQMSLGADWGVWVEHWQSLIKHSFQTRFKSCKSSLPSYIYPDLSSFFGFSCPGKDLHILWPDGKQDQQ